MNELRERINSMQEEIAESRERNGEIERLREMCKKHKLEAEIKEN
jgi:hypothetical protein